LIFYIRGNWGLDAKENPAIQFAHELWAPPTPARFLERKRGKELYPETAFRAVSKTGQGTLSLVGV
jgi:hypothetical protein